MATNNFSIQIQSDKSPTLRAVNWRTTQVSTVYNSATLSPYIIYINYGNYGIAFVLRYKLFERKKERKSRLCANKRMTQEVFPESFFSPEKRHFLLSFLLFIPCPLKDRQSDCPLFFRDSDIFPFDR